MGKSDITSNFKRIYEVLRRKESSFLRKVQDFLFEIFIIVIAVSISISLHGWTKQREEQNEVKTFLLGLKKDIREDINETNSVIESYNYYGVAYTYFYKLKKEEEPQQDTLHKYLQILGSNNFLRLSDTRFNSFLSVGKIGNIKDDSLALNILNLYQDLVPKIKSSEGGWITRNNQLNEYIMDNVKDVDDDLAYWEVLTTPKGKYLTKGLIPWQQIYLRYEDFKILGEVIIKQIDDRYPAG